MISSATPVAVLSAALASCTIATHERSLQQDQLPAPVMAAFRAQFPAAHVTRQALERKGGRVLYELETDGEGAPRSLIYTAGGKLAESELPIPFDQLPATVRAAALRLSPHGRVELAEIVQKDGKTLYEIHLVENGRSIEAVIDSNGAIVNKQYE